MSKIIKINPKQTKQRASQPWADKVEKVVAKLISAFSGGTNGSSSAGSTISSSPQVKTQKIIAVYVDFLARKRCSAVEAPWPPGVGDAIVIV